MAISSPSQDATKNAFGDLNLSITGIGREYPPFNLVPEDLDIICKRHYELTPAFVLPVLLLTLPSSSRNRTNVSFPQNQEDPPHKPIHRNRLQIRRWGNRPHSSYFRYRPLDRPALENLPRRRCTSRSNSRTKSPPRSTTLSHRHHTRRFHNMHQQCESWLRPFRMQSSGHDTNRGESPLTWGRV